MKAFSNLKEMIMSLGVDVYYHKIIEDILKNRHDHFCIIPELSLVDHTNFTVSAKNIYIRLLKDGHEKVKLSFPSTTLLDLPDYLEEDIKQKLNEQGISLTGIIAQAVDSGVRPGVLFQVKDQFKELKVWLE